VANYKWVFLLIVIMMIVAGAIGMAAVSVLYYTAFEEERQRLVEITQSQARLMESVARFNQTHSHSHLETSRAATLSQIKEAHEHYEGFGETGELMMAERRGDKIVFLWKHRHAEPDTPTLVSFHSNLAEPMRRALSGQSGTLVTPDIRGIKVLAAYEPVAILNLGIVAKLDLAEIRAPFLRAGSIVGGAALVLITVGTFLFFHVSNPMIRRIAVSEERFRSISTLAQDAIIMLDSDDKVSFWNKGAERTFGYSSGDATGRALVELIIPEGHREHYEVGIDIFRRTGRGPLMNTLVELEAVRKDGTSFPVEVSVSSVQLGGKRNTVWMIRDITARKEAQQRGQEKQRLIEHIIENVPHSIFWKDRDFVYLGCNKDFARQAGVDKPENIVGKTDYDLVWKKQEADLFRKTDKEVMESGEPQLAIEEPQLQADGTEATLLTSKVPLRDALGNVIGLLGIYADITDRKRAEEELSEREEQLRLILASTGEGIFGINTEGKCTFANRACAQLLGLQEARDLIGQAMHPLMHHSRSDYAAYPIEECPTYHACNQDKVIHVDGEVLWRADGTCFSTDYYSYPMKRNGQVVGAVVTFTDITERKEKDAQLLQAQKMELVGQLTGGFAHDCNNLLTIILGNLQLLEEEMGGEEELQELVADALSAARDGAELTQRLLTFSRKRTFQPQRIDINACLDDFARLARRTLGEVIELKIKQDNTNLVIFVDPAQFESALLNLAINARDAMPTGGTLSIETSNTRIDPNEALESLSLHPGTYVKISVCDTGIGMSPEDAARAIEPFYTTKANAKGSGLGLSMVYGFAKESGGEFLLRSTLGKGTTASLFLPTLSATGEQCPAHTTPRDLPRGTETILVVEDEPRVRHLAKRSLTDLGYRVLETENASAAMEVLETEPGVDLVFSDIVMPGGVNGYELASWIVKNRPKLNVLLASGFKKQLANEHLTDKGLFPLLQKPYTKAQLAKAIRAALSEA
jgi:two-component system cell cycle sensor histidine kinase/response regulator CckA